MPTVARLFNFVLLAGALVYFLRTPLAGYLASRGGQIRQDLVTAAEMRATATTQLAEIEQKLKALPAELDALKARGAEDVKAEQLRIAQAAAVERERLVEQTRREIEMRLRIARRELTELAAKLAVGIAEERIKRTITPEDHLRLVDRYTSQLKRRDDQPRGRHPLRAGAVRRRDEGVGGRRAGRPRPHGLRRAGGGQPGTGAGAREPGDSHGPQARRGRAAARPRRRISPVLAKILLLLADRDRLRILPDLAAGYRERLMQHAQVVRAEVVTAAPIPADRVAAMKAAWRARPGGTCSSRTGSTRR